MKKLSFNKQYKLAEFGKLYTVHGSSKDYEMFLIKETGHKESWTISKTDHKVFNTERLFDQELLLIEFIDKSNSLDIVEVETE